MVAQAPLLRQSRFLNQIVIDRSTTETVGRIEQVWMDPAVHRVLGFVCKSGLLRGRRAVFALPQIHMLGDDSIVLRSSPTKADIEQVRQLESLIGLEVWSEAGQHIGKVNDCVFSLKTGRIQHYLMTLEGWQGFTAGIYQLAPAQIVSYGDRRIMIYDVAAQNLEVYQPGLEQRLNYAREHLKEDYTHWSKKALRLTEQAKNRLSHWTEQAAHQVQEIAEQTTDWDAEPDSGPDRPTAPPHAAPASSSQANPAQANPAQANLGRTDTSPAESTATHAQSVFDCMAESNPGFQDWFDDGNSEQTAGSWNQPSSGSTTGSTTPLDPAATQTVDVASETQSSAPPSPPETQNVEDDDDEPWI